MSDESTEIVEIKEAVTQLTPVSLIEKSLSSFLDNAFRMAINDDLVRRELLQELVNRKKDLKSTELIAALTSFHTNQNDMISKLISPSMQLLTAAQQNEMSARQKIENPQYQQTNIREINAQASPDVLSGLSALFNLVTTMKPAQKEELPEKEDSK
jgi:hypothetical protein